jgi:hypothetical protein
MAAAFDLALARVQQQDIELLGRLPEHVNQLARAADHTFRNTELTPGNTLGLFLRQIACGNVACTAVRHLASSDFTDSAWCQARKRLPMELIRQVQQLLVEDARRELNVSDDVGTGQDSYRWRGHRVHVMDGTSDSMPDTPPLRSYYGVPSGCRAGLGFPTSHLLLLMDHRSGLFLDCLDGPMVRSDISQTPAMHAQLAGGDVLLGDDAFSGWAHLALILQANLHAVLPVHHRRIVNFTAARPHAHPRKGKSTKRTGKPRSRVVQTLGHDDQLVEYFKPVEQPAWISDEQWKALPESITVREIRRTVKRNGFRPITVTIVTTLLDPQRYPADELIELRLSRWMIETNIRHLKTTLGMDALKCKTLEGVRKERLVFLLVYNLIRIVMLRAARRQQVNVNRVSFADTLAWVRFGQLSAAVVIELIINPLRPGRLEPRVLKRQKKEFPYMTQSRAQLKSQLRATHCDTT